MPLSPAHRVFAGFAIYSFSMGSIFPRIPDVQHAMGVAEGALGLGLIGAPVGTLIALTFATPLLERIGFRRALMTAIPLLAFLYAVAVHAQTPLELFLLLIPVGLTIGSIEIMLNLEADRTEHLVGYRIMNRSHAFWSIGFFSAGLFGAAMAQMGLSPQLHLALCVPISLAAVLYFLSGYEPSAHRPTTSDAKPPRLATPTMAIMILVAATVSAMLLEGGSLDWSSIYMRDVFGATPFLQGFVVAAFALSQGATRFFADGFVDRSSPANVARAMLCVLLVGCLLVTFSPVMLLSLLGFALMGMGSAVIFPLAMSAAAQRHDRASSTNVAALAQISFTVFLLGPPLLGFAAEHWGIRTSFGIGLPFIVLSLLTAGALGMRQITRSA
jgi:MFS family permease